jgi:hypothetical protein
MSTVSRIRNPPSFPHCAATECVRLLLCLSLSWRSPVFFARILLFLSFAALLVNCAGQVNLAKYALAEQNFSGQGERKFRKPSTEYRAAREPKEIAGQGGAQNFNVPDRNLPIQDMHEARVDAEKSDFGIVRRTVGTAIAGVQPARSLPTVAPSPFLETLAKEDKENQDLKKKTAICRGC